MNYQEVTTGTFIKRVNRFIAHVEIDGTEQIVHVKNTGRCKELLIPGTKVILEKAQNPARKTPYSLVAVYKGDLLVNMDSQAPNQVVYETLLAGKVKEIPDLLSVKKEVTFGNSRFDLFVEMTQGKGWIEVKGVTLEENGIAMFPDAPTKRGTKHIYELVEAMEQGDQGYIFFLIQLKGIRYFTPNKKMDPDFAAALHYAANKGVRILCYDSIVTEKGIDIGEPVPVIL
jgi:sugar fermentation stimulation protein A